MGINKPTKTTYSELKCRYEVHLKDFGRQSQVNNFNTIIKTWIEACGISESSTIGSELNGEFESTLKQYVLTQEQKGIKQSTYRSRISHLRTIKKFYELEIVPDELPNKFHSALSRSIATAGFSSLRDFYRNSFSDICNFRRLQYWYSGRFVPSIDALPIIKILESRLRLKDGTLASLLPKILYGRGKTRLIGQTSYGRKIIVAKKKPYGHWSQMLETEWDGVIKFMTAPYLPEGQKRNSVWTSSDSSKGTHIPSADIGKGYLKSFFGFCCLAESHDPLLSGLGMRSQRMTLALLTEKTLVEKYLEFQKIRAGGLYTKGTLAFINLTTLLLRAETGYLYQLPKFANKLDKSMPTTRWRERCRNTRERLLSIRSQLLQNSLIVKGRDPEEPIKLILTQARPLHVLLQMLKDMQQDMPSTNSSKRTQALHYRNILLVGLLTSNPLRIRQFTIMQFDRHLKRRNNGEWWLEFKKGEFKNRLALKSDYSVRVEQHIWPIIERYRDEFRQHLSGAYACAYVFRPDPRVKIGTDNSKPISENSLGLLLQHLTSDYIELTPGFFPHAFRHIVATDIIKKNPEFGFFLASKALHDKLETVENTYAHLRTHEYFEPVNRHFASAWEEVIGVGKAKCSLR